jgi:signal transduction histidine kinase
MSKRSVIASIEKNFSLLAALLLTGILFAEAVLLTVYSDSYKTKTEAAERQAAENRRMNLEHLLEQLEAEIDFVIRQEREEALRAARQRVESFAASVREVRETPGAADNEALFEYLKTANSSAGEEYVYALAGDKLLVHPLKGRLKRVILSNELERLKELMTEMPYGSSAVTGYSVHTETGDVVEKTAYIKKLAPDGMIIGSGFCNEKSTEKIQNYIISQLENLNENGNSINFFAVAEKNRDTIKIIKTAGNIRTDSAYMDKLASRLGEGKGSFFYEIPEGDTGSKNLRMTVVRRITPWNWLVAAGVNEPSSEITGKNILRDHRHKFYTNAAISALTALLLMYAVFVVVSRGKRLFIESVENSYKKAEEREEELEQIGKRLSSDHASAMKNEKRLKEIKENLEKTVEDRIKDLQDISTHLRSENLKISKVTEELIAARKKATEASMVKTEFLANMSHEIRTPMHAVLSYSSFGMKKFENTKDTRQKNYFGKITESADRLLSFINDLIDLSDLESGRMKYKISQCRAADLLREAVKELERAFLEKKITAEIPENDIMICGDAAKLRQVFLNIYSNAAKFSPPDSVITTEIEPENSFLKITVTDCGPGVDESEKLLIFEKFTQSSKTKTGAGGIGLGLAICREIVTDHGGRIYVTDNPEGGSRFTVELPLF